MELDQKEISALRQTARVVVRELGLLKDTYFDIGVTLAMRHLLIELDSAHNPTVNEIAARLLLDKSSASRLIARAVKKGYVRYERDPQDKRKRVLQLTGKGVDTLHAFEKIAQRQVNEALDVLDAQQVRTVQEGMALFARGLQASRLSNEQKASKKDFVAVSKTQVKPLRDIYALLEERGLVLEHCRKEDEEKLYSVFADVVKAGIYFPYEEASQEEFRRHFFSPGSQVYVCKTKGGDVLGGFFLRPNISGRSGHIANAAYMLRQDCRGLGVGRLLCEASLHLAKNRGFLAMQYNLVLSNNKSAIHLYQTLGFDILGTIPAAVRTPDNSYQSGYIMYRNLDL